MGKKSTELTEGNLKMLLKYYIIYIYIYIYIYNIYIYVYISTQYGLDIFLLLILALNGVSKAPHNDS